jgi:hypothetical protein
MYPIRWYIWAWKYNRNIISNCCVVHNNFHIKMKLSSSLPGVVCITMTNHVLFTLFVFIYVYVSNTYYNVFCFVCPRLISYVPNVASFSWFHLWFCHFVIRCSYCSDSVCFPPFYYVISKLALNKRERIPTGQSKMDKPEKLATLGT